MWGDWYRPAVGGSKQPPPGSREGSCSITTSPENALSRGGSLTHGAAVVQGWTPQCLLRFPEARLAPGHCSSHREMGSLDLCHSFTAMAPHQLVQAGRGHWDGLSTERWCLKSPGGGLGALPRIWACWAHLMPLVRAPVGRGQSLGETQGCDTKDTPTLCGKQLPLLSINPWSPTAPCSKE